MAVSSICDTDWRKGRLGDSCGKFLSVDMTVSSVCDTDWSEDIMEATVVEFCSVDLTHEFCT